MRKISQIFGVLILGVIALVSIWGGVKASVPAIKKAADNGIDLSECYVFGVDAATVGSVTYNTSKQANIVAPKITEGDKNFYYISSAESPTRISIYPKSGSAIASVASSDKSLSSFPDGVFYYTSELATGEIYNVTIKPMSEVRCGKMTVTISDPTDIRVQRRTAMFSRTYLAESFTDNKLVVAFDPNTETNWTISRDDSKRIFMATVNGVPAVRAEGAIFKTSNSATIQTYMPINLTEKDNEVKVTIDYPDNEIPLKIGINPTEGSNDTNQSALNNKITMVTVAGREIERSEWESEDFRVKNGSQVNLTFANQLRGVFELGNAHLNGVAHTSRSSFIIESDEDNPAQQTITVDALVLNPLRYSVKSNGYDKFGLFFSYDQVEMTSDDYNDEVSYFYKKGSVKSLYGSGYRVKTVKLNGTALEPVRKDVFEFPTSQDMKLEVEVEPFVRDKKMKIFIDPAYYDEVDIDLDPDGVLYERVSVPVGLQELSYNQTDLPISIRVGRPYIYVNGELQQPDENGYYLADYKEGELVKVFTRMPSVVSVTYESMDATITHDGVTVAPGQTYNVMQGTIVRIVPKSTASDLVVQTSLTTFADKKADKSFEFTVQNSCTVSLHPKNLETTVKLTDMDDKGEYLYRSFVVRVNGSEYKLTGTSTTIALPYVAGTTKYALTFVDLNRNYEVESVTTTNSSGTSFNKDTQTITGVGGLSTLTLKTKKIDKPYTANINILIDYSSSFCPFQFITQNNKQDYGMGEMGDPLEGGWNTPATLPNLKLSEDDFPVTIKYLKIGEGVDEGGWDERFVIGNNYHYTIFGDDDLEQPDPIVDDYGNPLPTPSYYAYVIEEPQNINMVIGRTTSTSWTPLGFNVENCEFMFSVDGGEFLQYDPEMECLNYMRDYSNSVEQSEFENENTIKLFKGSEIRLKPTEGNIIQNLIIKDQYDNESDAIEPDENGIYHIFNSEDFMYSIGINNFDLYYTVMLEPIVAGESIEVTLKTNDGTSGADSNFTLNHNGEIHYLCEEPVELKVGKNAGLKITCVNHEMMVTKVIDQNNQQLPYDQLTGEIFGLTDGMELTLMVEELEYDKQFTIYYPRTSNVFTAIPEIVIGKGTMYEKTITLYNYSNYTQSQVVRYSNVLGPVVCRNGTLQTDASKAADLYINDEKVAYSQESGYVLPAYLPENAVMRLVVPGTGANTVTASDVTYEIDQDIFVQAKQDGRVVATESAQTKAAVGTSIRVVADPDKENKYNYTITYSLNGGTYNTMPASGITVANTNKTITVKVAKAYNAITVEGAEDTDISKLKITADGEEYPIAAGANVINIPTHVKEMTVVTTEEGKYVEAVSGLTFDANTGVVSGLKKATITVSVKEIERPMEVTVYLDSEELSGGSIVLGNGKVIESNASVGEGYNTINFSEEDLPIIYRINEQVTDGEIGEELDASSLPTVYVNGEQLEYSHEHGGYVFPIEALTGSEPPVIKIYPPVPEGVEPVAPVKLTYLVEPGIEFLAVEDRVTEIAEAGMRDVLPGTEIVMQATATNGDDIFVEVDGVRVQPTDGKYTLSVGQTDMEISVKFEKLDITLYSDEWRHVRIVGAGLEYPMYDASSTLQFPQKTSEFTVYTTSEGSRVTGIKDGEGNMLPFDLKTGKLTGVSAGMTLEVVLGEYARTVSLAVYLEETEEEEAEAQPISHVVLAAGTTVEKALPLVKGYQTITLAHEDLPLAVTTIEGVEAIVFLNNEQLEMADGEYKFPEELPEGSIVKIFTAKEEGIAKAEVNYDFASLRDFEVEIHHDHLEAAVDNTKTHQLLPGTEINFTVKAKAAPAKMRAMAEEAETETGVPFTVTANDEELQPQEDGSYMVKINDDHIANGLNIKVEQPAIEDPDVPTGIDEIATDGKRVDVYSLSGVMLKRGADAESLRTLPAGVYIIDGQKVVINNK